MRCTLFEYSNEDMETGVGVIDEIDRDFAYQYKLQLASPKAATILSMYISILRQLLFL